MDVSFKSRFGDQPHISGDGSDGYESEAPESRYERIVVTKGEFVGETTSQKKYDVTFLSSTAYA